MPDRMHGEGNPPPRSGYRANDLPSFRPPAILPTRPYVPPASPWPAHQPGGHRDTDGGWVQGRWPCGCRPFQTEGSHRCPMDTP